MILSVAGAPSAMSAGLAMLAAVLDQLPQPASVASLSGGRVLFVNRGFVNLFGSRLVDGATMADLAVRLCLWSSDRSSARQFWIDLPRQAGAGVSELPSAEFLAGCADGTARPVRQHGVVLADGDVVVSIFEDVSSRKSAEDALSSLVYHDPVTGLSNRRALEEHWSEETGRSPDATRRAALLLIEFDGLDAIELRFGRLVADEVLAAAARRLRQTVSIGDLVCRAGRQQFVAYIAAVDDAAKLEATCRQVFDVLSEPLLTNAGPFNPGIRIGCAQSPTSGHTLQRLMTGAEQALDALKRAGRDGWQWSPTPASPRHATGRSMRA